MNRPVARISQRGVGVTDWRCHMVLLPGVKTGELPVFHRGSLGDRLVMPEGLATVGKNLDFNTKCRIQMHLIVIVQPKSRLQLTILGFQGGVSFA